VLGPKSLKQKMILTNKAKVLFAGGAAGSGKSFLLLLMILQFVDCPHWRGVIFRRTQPEIKDPGGLFDEAMQLYMSLPEKFRPTAKIQDLSFKFPSGAVLKLAGMEYDKDRMRWHGSQLSFVGWDELCTFSDIQYWYLMSRLRSKSKYPTMVRGTMNPDPDSFVLDIISWWIDPETGFPIEERAGIIRWYIRQNGELIWGDTKEELKKKYGDKVRPVSFSFIPATIYDNPVVLENNPDYLADLESLQRVDRDRLLHGNWLTREKSSVYFKRDDLNKLDRVPSEAVCVRSWDKASTEPHEGNPYPDYSASIKMYKTTENEFVIAGEWHHSNRDAQNPNIYGRFRFKPGKRDNLILNQAKFDGDKCIVVLPRDAGGHGETEYIESAKKLAVEGFVVKKDLATNASSKLQKFLPFSASCENHLISIVESTFPNKETLEAFYKELEAFSGERSGKLRKDDWVDCVATAYNYLCKETVIPNFSLPSCSANSNIIKMKTQINS
jgi:phage terminase large subunit-like protein